MPGLVPDEDFFRHLANRTFVAGRFIRTPEQIDYLQEPDVFHDVFGHVPLLANPVFADYMQAYGEGGLRSLQFGALRQLARLYWYTVEFGLIREGGDLRLYGAGIVSSFGESGFARGRRRRRRTWSDPADRPRLSGARPGPRRGRGRRATGAGGGA